MSVKAKKHLGQHFLTDKNICRKISDQYQKHQACTRVLEIGPGMGALTEFLLQRGDLEVHVMDIDLESIRYLEENFADLGDLPCVRKRHKIVANEETVRPGRSPQPMPVRPRRSGRRLA